MNVYWEGMYIESNVYFEILNKCCFVFLFIILNVNRRENKFKEIMIFFVYRFVNLYSMDFKEYRSKIVFNESVISFVR